MCEEKQQGEQGQGFVPGTISICLDIDDPVTIKDTGRHGKVVGIYTDQHRKTTYQVKYADADGFITDCYFRIDELKSNVGATE